MTPSHLRDNLKGLDVKISLEDARGMVELADTNGSHAVEWPEFLEMMDAFWGHPKPPRWQLWWTSWLEAARRNDKDAPPRRPANALKRRGSLDKLEPLDAAPTRWGGTGLRTKLDPEAIAGWKRVFDATVGPGAETMGLRDLTKATKLSKTLAAKLFKHLDASDAGTVSLPTFLDVCGKGGAPPATAWWKPLLEALGEKSPSTTKRRASTMGRRGSLSSSLDSSPAASERSLGAHGRSLPESPASTKRSPSLRRASRSAADLPKEPTAVSLSPPLVKRHLPSLRGGKKQA